MFLFFAGVFFGAIVVAVLIIKYEIGASHRYLCSASGPVEILKIHGDVSPIPGFLTSFIRILLIGTLRKQGQLCVPRDKLPHLKIRKEGVQVSAAHLHRYQQLCGYPQSGDLFCVYVEHFTFPYLIQLLSDTMFPLSPLGLIHVAQTFDCLDTIAIGESFDFELFAAPSDFRQTESGVELTGHLTVFAHNSSRVLMRATATLLSRQASKVASRAKRNNTPIEPSAVAFAHQVPANFGVQYARISGDWNPHHLWPATARLLGYKKPIVQGLWTVARGLAAINVATPFRVECKFAKPLFMPSEVSFEYANVDAAQLENFELLSPENVSFVCVNKQSREPHVFVKLLSIPTRSSGSRLSRT